MLEETKVVLEEPLPIPEPQVEYEDAPTVAEREARNRLARVRVILENEEWVTRESKVGHNVFYHEVGNVPFCQMAQRNLPTKHESERKGLSSKKMCDIRPEWPKCSLCRIQDFSSEPSGLAI